MKLFYKLLLPALLLPSLSIAQANYKSGYVINLKGDTLRGFIDTREWRVNPKAINFKAALNEGSRHLGINDIRYFNINDEVAYQKYAGLIETDATLSSDEAIQKSAGTVTDTVFLKVEQQGDKVTLFVYADNQREHYFIADNEDGKPVELVYNVHTDDSEAISQTAYMRQLYALARKYHKDTEALKTGIERSEYKVTSLEGITGQINSTIKKSKSSGAILFAGAGVAVSSISLEAHIGDHALSQTSVSPKLSVGYNILADPASGRLVLRPEIAFYFNSFNGAATVGNYTYGFKFNQYNFAFIPQLLYNFYNTEAYKFYGAVGASLNIAAYSNNKFTHVDNKYLTTETNTLKLARGWTSFPLKIGAIINKKFDVSAGYIPTAHFGASASGYPFSAHTVQASLNYLFY